MFRNTSFWPSLKPARRSSTASSMFRRRTSKPVALRCAVPYTADETSACTSKRKGRLPSSMADMAVPESPASCMGMSISEGLATSRRPDPVISKTASSEVEPKRFLMLRSTRYAPRFSPSNCSTTSTMCSRILGPAMVPSLVMWPMRITGMPLLLAKRSSCAATSLIWLTLPAVESTCWQYMVCTESTIMRSGATSSASERMAPISVSL